MLVIILLLLLLVAPVWALGGIAKSVDPWAVGGGALGPVPALLRRPAQRQKTGPARRRANSRNLAAPR